MRAALWLACAAMSGCANPPAETITLNVDSIRDIAADEGPYSVVVHRGVIQSVEKQKEKEGDDAHLEPGRFELWPPGPPPTQRELVERLRGGVTSLALPDQPLADALALRQYVGTGRGRGPRIYPSGPELGSGLGDNATAMRYRGRVQDHVALGCEFVVIDASRGREAVCTVVDECKRQSCQVWLRASSQAELAAALPCAPQVVWVQDGFDPSFPEDARETTWILPSTASSPPGVQVARYGAPTAPVIETSVHAARPLNREFALGRVTQGYIADFRIERGQRIDVYLQGVLQTPAQPWLSGLLLGWEKFQIESRIPDDL